MRGHADWISRERSMIAFIDRSPSLPFLATSAYKCPAVSTRPCRLGGGGGSSSSGWASCWPHAGVLTVPHVTSAAHREVVLRGPGDDEQDESKLEAHIDQPRPLLPRSLGSRAGV